MLPSSSEKRGRGGREKKEKHVNTTLAFFGTNLHPLSLYLCLSLPPSLSLFLPLWRLGRARLSKTKTYARCRLVDKRPRAAWRAFSRLILARRHDVGTTAQLDPSCS